MKIDIKESDYQWHGRGFNEYNFIENVIPRISTWLLDEYHKKAIYNESERSILYNKLIGIAEIIDEESYEQLKDNNRRFNDTI